MAHQDTVALIRTHSSYALEIAYRKREKVLISLAQTMGHVQYTEQAVKGEMALALLERLIRCLGTLTIWRAHSTPDTDRVQCRALCTTIYIFELFSQSQLFSISMEQLWNYLAQTAMWKTVQLDGTAPTFLDADTHAMLVAYRGDIPADQITAMECRILLQTSATDSQNDMAPFPGVPSDTASPPSAGRVGNDDLVARFNRLKSKKN